MQGVLEVLTSIFRFRTRGKITEEILDHLSNFFLWNLGKGGENVLNTWHRVEASLPVHLNTGNSKKLGVSELTVDSQF